MPELVLRANARLQGKIIDCGLSSTFSVFAVAPVLTVLTATRWSFIGAEGLTYNVGLGSMGPPWGTNSPGGTYTE